MGLLCQFRTVNTRPLAFAPAVISISFLASYDQLGYTSAETPDFLHHRLPTRCGAHSRTPTVRPDCYKNTTHYASTSTGPPQSLYTNTTKPISKRKNYWSYYNTTTYHYYYIQRCFALTNVSRSGKSPYLTHCNAHFPSHSFKLSMEEGTATMSNAHYDIRTGEEKKH